MSENTQFKKGESGNPNGRPKGKTNKVPSDKKIEDDLKKCFKGALDKLWDLVNSKDEATALKASSKIIDKVYDIVMQDKKASSPTKKSSTTEDELEFPKPSETVQHKSLKLN